MTNTKIQVGRFELDLLYHQISLSNGRFIVLTSAEFRIIYLLITASHDHLFDRKTIIDFVWKNQRDKEKTMRTVDVHVRRIRNKLDGLLNLGGDLIETVSKEGYRINQEMLNDKRV